LLVPTHLVAIFVFTLSLVAPSAFAEEAAPRPPAADAVAPAAPTPEPVPVAASKTPFRTQGIYLQQPVAMTPRRLEHMIDNALDVGVDTLVVDLWSRQKNYKTAVDRIHERGLKYVPRIVMFADGGTHEQVNDRTVWEERWQLANYALELGAKDIQLDYIRYSSKNSASPQNALDIREVLRFFKKRINDRGGRLQIDLFGEVGYAPSVHIGQDMTLFAPEVDGVCPMVYPSHYEPFEEHLRKPYETVHSSLLGFQRQIGTNNVSVYAYIELFNHRFKLTTEERVDYIRAQLRAAREAHAAGWIAWSAGNKYDILFDLLRRYRADASA
jgi:Putative glycosyl hydrolase domain